MQCEASGALDVTHTCDSKLIIVGNHAYHFVSSAASPAAKNEEFIYVS